MELSKDELLRLKSEQNKIILSRNATFKERQEANKLVEKYVNLLKNFD